MRERMRELFSFMASAEFAFDAWRALEALSVGKTLAMRLKIRKSLANPKNGPQESIITYILRGKEVTTSLQYATGELTSDANLVDFILLDEPYEYEYEFGMLVTL